MNKRSYRSLNVKDINWQQVEQSLTQPCIFAIDIAKKRQFGLLMDRERHIHLQVNWEHPEETPLLLAGLKPLGVKVEGVVMEPSGVYGDTLRHLFHQAGYPINKAGPKRVHDAAEIYDGVPSLHDAKSAYIIARLYFENTCSLWVAESDAQRELQALTKQYDLYSKNYHRLLNQTEAMLQRHWPELSQFFNLDSVALETLLLDYGHPARLRHHQHEVHALVRRVTRGKTPPEKVDAFLEATKNSIGLSLLEAEQDYLQSLAEEMQRNRLKLRAIHQQLEVSLESRSPPPAMVEKLGVVASSFALANRLDPLDYPNAGSYLKAYGLNLKEKSSGQQQGQLKLSKRGASSPRLYLYFAAMRLIQQDPLVKQWYQQKVKRDGGQQKMKALIAVMRKLVKGIWATRRGDTFDSSKLVTVRP